MSAEHTFRFREGHFTLRPTRKGDLDLAWLWTMRDTDHAGRVEPEFWLEQNAATDTYLLSDPLGPVFFFRIDRFPKGSSEAGEPAAQLHIQFFPAQSMDGKMRIAEALAEGFRWLLPMLRLSGVKETFFDSASPRLIAFCVRRLGFTEKDGILKKAIA
jgi:hypothetical protein